MKLELELPDKKEQTEQERRDYCASVFAIFPRIEQDIKSTMYEQLVSTYTEADNWDKILKGQGIMEGMAVLLEKWSLANSEHIANITNKDEEI